MAQQPIVNDEDEWVDTDNPVNTDWQDVNPYQLAPPTAPVQTATPVAQENTPVSSENEWVDSEPAAEPNFLQRSWSAVSTPLTTLPSELASGVADRLDAPSLNMTVPHARLRGLGAGTVQSLGDLASEATSPINLAATLLGGGGFIAAKRGLKSGAKLLEGLTRATSAPVVAHGATNLLHPESTWGERGMGLLEMLGGAIGLKGGLPKTAAQKAEELLVKEAQNTPSPTPRSFRNLTQTPTDTTAFEITNNQARPGRGPREGDLTARIGGEQVTNNADETVRNIFPERPKTATGFEHTPSTLNAEGQPKVTIQIDPLTGQPADEMSARFIADSRINKPVPEVDRISPDREIELPVTKNADGTEYNPWKDPKQYYGLPRAIQSAYDLSYPFRQGLGLIHTKGWWKSWSGMVKSMGSERSYQGLMDSISERPNFQRRQGGPSFAEEAGLGMTDLKNLTKREENLTSALAEKLPGVRASNRAYTAFANKLRADVFDDLIRQAEANGLDPRKNMELAKSIASYVNNASGRGTLGSWEGSATKLNNLFFSPRLIASRVQMLNPVSYAMRDKFTNKQYLKSLASMATAWTTMAGLAKAGGADVSLDPQSSDFGKIKIGNTRLDPAGGFQQYLVLLARMKEMANNEKSGRYNSKNPNAPTPLSDVGNFLENKLAPNASFLGGPALAYGHPNRPFELGDRALRMFSPIMVQDINELIREDADFAKLIGVTAASAVGFGSTTYEKGEPDSRLMPESILPREDDLSFPLGRRRR